MPSPDLTPGVSWVRDDAVTSWPDAEVILDDRFEGPGCPHRIAWRGGVVHTLEPYPDPRLGLPPFWSPLAFRSAREANRVLDAYRDLAFLGHL